MFYQLDCCLFNSHSSLLNRNYIYVFVLMRAWLWKWTEWMSLCGENLDLWQRHHAALLLFLPPGFEILTFLLRLLFNFPYFLLFIFLLSGCNFLSWLSFSTACSQPSATKQVYAFKSKRDEWSVCEFVALQPDMLCFCHLFGKVVL